MFNKIRCVTAVLITTSWGGAIAQVDLEERVAAATSTQNDPSSLSVLFEPNLLETGQHDGLEISWSSILFAPVRL